MAESLTAIPRDIKKTGTCEGDTVKGTATGQGPFKPVPSPAIDSSFAKRRNAGKLPGAGSAPKPDINKPSPGYNKREGRP